MFASKHSQKALTSEARIDTTSPEDDNMVWKRWCRLCAKEDEESNLCVFPEIKEPGNIMDNTLATAIGKFFWVNIKTNDEISKFICLECHTLVCSLTQFTERVNKVQAMFCALQNINSGNCLDLNEVRLQYGLLDMDWEHIIKQESVIEGQQIKDDKDDKQSIDECEWELDGDDNKEETEVLELQTEDEPKAEGKLSVELMKRGTKRKRNAADDDDENCVTEMLGALIGEFEEDTEEHFIIEKATTEEEIDDVELLRQLRGEEVDEDDKAENEKAEENYESVNLREDGLSDNESLTGNDKCGSCEKSPQVNKIDSSSRVRKRRRGRPSNYIVNDNGDLEKADIYSGEDTNENSQLSFKYECSICQKKYKNPTSYRKHTLEKHNKVPDIPDFKCETCNKIYPTERQLEIHARSHMALEDKLDIPCPYCERKFTKVSVMRQHVRGIHENKKPYVCDECGRPIKTLAALVEHKLVHTNDTPYECEVCQRAFKNKARLKAHLETHTDSSFICSECGLLLNTRRTLKMHMLVHSDAKRYKCDFCPAAFKRTKALKNHLILHTGMRPYKCNFCEKTFSNGSNCRSHKKKMHAQELAEEEAMGKKAQAVTVPKLEELRSSTNVVGNPRKVQRHHGGLPLHMRQLLIAAEERAKRVETTKQTTDVQPNESVVMYGEETQTHSIEESTIQLEADDGSEIIELHEDMLADDDEEDDDEEGETVVYEIIAEI
ncbi:zinc finger protein 600-like isoform X1 [Anastrepha ludens]|uniref:zinc finger protein 600-like isoform X1 n=2 Tax=Anastrepha ludens TaxID=28586 RepID=UPI0023AF2FF1|nr:zinc finger protein 600-like isoform X1 [Anastrepha ludens]